MQNNDENLAKLAEAISNVGYWTWWDTEQHVKSIQLEFAGVQLFIPPENREEAPSNQVALRFILPSSIQFFHTTKLADDWPEKLANDEVDPYLLDAEKFLLSGDLDMPEFLSAAHITRELHPNDIKPVYQLAFLAGDVGFRVTAKDIRIFCHKGEIKLSEVPLLSANWWKYRDVYMACKNTDNALPEDYACDVTTN